MATKTTLLASLRVLMILIFCGWVSLWLLKPTDLWIRQWKKAEDGTRSTIVGYYGLNFAVFTFPLIGLTIVGLVYLNLLSWKPYRRQATYSTTFSNPLVVSRLVGVLSGIEILSVSLFILFLAWTFYAQISGDLIKLMPIKSLELKIWELKYLRVATRFGLLAEACLALLLLPILRGLSLFRLLGIQFEASVKYHIWLGTSMIFFATCHGGSTLFVWGVSQYIRDETRKWQSSGRIYLAGEITLVTGLVIWITSLPQVRRKTFEIFYFTHHLYIIFLVFYLFHAGDRHFYTVFSGIFLFGLDKILRIIQSRPESCILSARVFPCKSVELILPKDSRLKYAPTSVVYVKIPSISKFQWHAFSITSSSKVDDYTISIMIKCEGSWTNSLYEMINNNLELDSVPLKCIPVAIEGPYEPASMDFLSYDSLLAIGGGIGITPILSILQEIGSAKAGNLSSSAKAGSRYKFPMRIQLIHVVKKSQDISLLNSISDLLSEQSSEGLNLKLKVFVTKEEDSGESLSELMKERFSQIQTTNFSTKCSNNPVQGLGSVLWMAGITMISSVVFLFFLICFNRIAVPADKKVKKIPKHGKVAKDKTASSVLDLLLIASFFLAVLSCAIIAIALRWRRLKKGAPPILQKQGGKDMELINSATTRSVLEEHEIHFGRRPNFQDIFSGFRNEIGEREVGVLVCGPESMKESVAIACKQNSRSCKMSGERNKLCFNFHSLNFTL